MAVEETGGEQQGKKARAADLMRKAWTAATDEIQIGTRAVKDHVRDGEEVMAVLRGQDGGMIVATNQRRVFVVKKPSLGGGRMTTRIAAFDSNQITGIHVRTGLINQGWVVVHAAGYNDVTKRKDAEKADNAIMIGSNGPAKKAVAEIQHLLSAPELSGQSSDSPASPGPEDIADQIRKLAGLRDSGLLTPDEFESKKQELLSRM